jgi:hypothetical protein
MSPELNYRVSANSASDWYWEVYTDESVFARGLAPTKLDARTAALKAAMDLESPPARRAS